MGEINIKNQLLFQFTFVFFVCLLCRFEFNLSIGDFSKCTYREKNKTFVLTEFLCKYHSEIKTKMVLNI